MGDYDDIIHLPRPISERRQKMSVSDRAAQFAPFSALTGYDDTVNEVQRITSERIELDEYEKELIDRRLQYLFENIKSNPRIKVIYFTHDSKKSGGAYNKVEGALEKIDDFERTLIVADQNSKTEIEIEEIFSLEICNL